MSTAAIVVTTPIQIVWTSQRAKNRIDSEMILLLSVCSQVIRWQSHSFYPPLVGGCGCDYFRIGTTENESCVKTRYQACNSSRGALVCASDFGVGGHMGFALYCRHSFMEWICSYHFVIACGLGLSCLSQKENSVFTTHAGSVGLLGEPRTTA